MDDINQPVESIYRDNPVVHINKYDFEEVLLKVGSLLYNLHNKNISPTFLFLTVTKEEPLQNILKQITGIPTTMELLKTILHFYPSLLKSKIIKEKSIKHIKKIQKKNHLTIF